MNRVRFDSNRYGAEAIIKERNIIIMPIMTQAQVDIPFKISRSEAILQDLYFSFDKATEFSDSTLFDISQLSWRPFEWNPNWLMAVSFEMDLDFH